MKLKYLHYYYLSQKVDLWMLHIILLTLFSLIYDVSLHKISESNTGQGIAIGLQTMEGKASRRYKRNVDNPINCTKLQDDFFANCTSSKFWTLDIVKNRTSFCHDVTQSSKRTECLNKFLCNEAEGNSCLQIVNNLNAKCRNLTVDINKGPSLEQSAEILDVLCSTYHSQENCISNLTRVYDQLRVKADYKQSCNKTELSGAIPCSNKCSRVFKELKTSVGCCLRLLMDIYNSSNQEAFELSPDAWRRCGHGEPLLCTVDIKTTQQAIPSTISSSTKSTQSTSVPITKKTTKRLSMKMSSRLIAGIIIASIIFSIVSYIIARFFYQRYMRHKRLHYEDYGYSQLKVILDNDDLYHDEEEDDDDQLLSLT